MKYLKLITFMFCSHFGLAQSIVFNGDTLSAIIYQQYVEKDVNEFLCDDNVKEYVSYVFFDDKPGVLTGLLLKMPDGSYIEIIVDEFRYITKFSSKRKWKFSKFKKEQISTIKFIVGHDILLELSKAD
jgi:hypothetical protein